MILPFYSEGIQKRWMKRASDNTDIEVVGFGHCTSLDALCHAFKSSLKTYFYSLAFEWCCVSIVNSLIGALWNDIVNSFWYLFYFLLSPLPSLLNSVMFIVKHFGSTVLNLCSINTICLAFIDTKIYDHSWSFLKIC